MKNFDSINPGDQQRPPRIDISDKPKRPEGQVSLLQRQPQKRPRRLLKIIFGVVFILALGLSGFVLSRAMNLSSKIFVGQTTTFFQKIKAVFGAGSVKLQGEDLGQINILLLGIGGEGHDGPYLSDTMIIAQIRPDLGEISLTSIPRDYLASLPTGEKKINNAFSDGYMKKKDWADGGKAARQAAEKISGLTIPYFAVVDFSGFEQAVNTVGGIDLHVDRTFTDYSFPNDATLGYLAPQTFKEGDQHMDGKKALIFARSRHAEGPEGSDFARGARQQKVIQALKEKVLGLNIVGDAGKINTLLDVFADHFHTNISPAEILRVYNIVKEKNIKSFLSLSLDPDTKLVCPKILEETGAYVLVPCPGKNERDIENFFKNSFAIGKLYQEKSVVWLGTSGGDLKAYREADSKLKETNLTVWEVNYGGEPLSQNVFYQVNPKPATAEFIKNTLNAEESFVPFKGLKIDKDKVDVIVILGEQ